MESIVENEQELFEPSISERFSLITQYINLYYTPLLCLFGGFGNCVSLYIFCMTSSHRNLSSSYYLSALAISDTGFLINLMALWLTTDLGFNVITTKLSCPLVMFLGQVTCFLSVWFVVAFTVERFFAVCYPLTRPTVCTVSRAKKVIFAITLIALAAFSYVWVIAQVMEMNIPDEDGAMKEFGNNATSTVRNWTATTHPSTTFSASEKLNHRAIQLGETSYENTIFEEANGSSSLGIPDLDSRFSSRHEQLPKISPSPTYPELFSNHTNSTSAFTTRFICSVPREYYNFSVVTNYLDSFFTLILPFCIITFLNIRITICVWKFKGQRETIVAVGKSNNATTSVSNVKNVPRFSCSFRKNQNCVTLNNTRLSPNNCVMSSNTTSPTINETTLMTECIYQPNGSPSQAVGLEQRNTDEVNTYFSENDNAQGHAAAKLNTNENNLYTPTKAKRVVTSSANHQHSKNAAEVRVTNMLLLVSTVFLVLNLPSHGMRAAAFIQQAFWPDSNQGEASALHQWAYILFNTNFGVNFLLYCVSGKNFRKSLSNLLCCDNRRGRKRGNDGRSSMMMRHHQAKNRSNSYRNARQKRSTANMSMRRRVLKSFTQCPSRLGNENHTNTQNNELNLCDRDELENVGTRQVGERQMGHRHSSIQSTTFTNDPTTHYSTLSMTELM